MAWRSITDGFGFTLGVMPSSKTGGDKFIGSILISENVPPWEVRVSSCGGGCI